MPSRREGICAILALVYLALLPWHCQLRGPLYLHDLLAPALLAAVIWRGDWQRWRRLPDGALAGFLAVAALVTLLLRPTWLDLYELAIPCYMAVLYAFFSRTVLPRRALGAYALAVGLALWLVGFAQAIGGHVPTHRAYVGSTLGFLAQRYGFTFGNPNLLGSFAVLPVAAALLAIAGRPRREAIRLVGLAFVLGLPVVFSASRHLLLGVALVLGALPGLLPELSCRRLRPWLWVGFGGLALLTYLTVLIPFFPLQATMPFVNARTPGMYLIHQDAYLRMATHSPASLLLGVGQHAVRSRYPAAVDHDLAARVLAEYRMQDELLPSFLVYMDAHNEYLNLAVAFGLPALLCLGLFFWAIGRRQPGVSLGARLMPFFVAALATACLWDDLLSKRWIWVTLGLLAAATTTREDQTIPPTPAASDQLAGGPLP